MSASRNATIDEVHRRVGRNLVRFQMIEFSLKLSLPYIHRDGSKSGITALKKYKRELGVKTLSPLVLALSESVSASSGYFEHELKTIVDSRNDLVHHLLKLPGIDYMAPDATERLLKYLDEQFARSEELFALARELSLCTLLAIHESNPGKHPELEGHYAQLKKMVSPLTTFEPLASPKSGTVTTKRSRNVTSRRSK